MKDCFLHTHYGWCYYDMKDMLIYGLYVEPEFRRQGKAARLLKMVIAEMRANGYNGPIKIAAAPDERGISKHRLAEFYRSLGLAVINEQKANVSFRTPWLSARFNERK